MTLAEVREGINEVDDQIRELFLKRMALADQVACVKAQTADAIYKPDREKAVIERLTKEIDPAMRLEYIALIRKVMGVSRMYQYGRTLEMRDCLKLPADLDVKPEHNRFQFLFVCPEECGALAGVLSVIADYGVNLTEFHRCSDEEGEWKEGFFAELQGNLLDPNMQALVFQLQSETKAFQLLASL